MSIITFVKENPYSSQISEHLKELNGLSEEGKIDEFICIYKVGDEYHHLWSGTDNIYALVGKLESIKQKQLKRLEQ